MKTILTEIARQFAIMNKIRCLELEIEIRLSTTKLNDDTLKTLATTLQIMVNKINGEPK